MTDITARLLVAYAAGVLALLNWLGAAMYAPLALVPFTVAVVVALPPSRRTLARKWNLRVSTGAAVMLYVVCTLAGNAWYLAVTLAG